jgi:Tfp pilus assembly protein PilF
MQILYKLIFSLVIGAVLFGVGFFALQRIWKYDIDPFGWAIRMLKGPSEKIPVIVEEPSSENFVKCSQYQNESCPLKISAISFKNPPPKNSEHAGIKWNEYHSEVRLMLMNQGENTIEDISIEIEPETHIEQALQITQIPDVTLAPDKGPIGAMVFEPIDDKGEQSSIRVDGIGMTPSYRLFCLKLLPMAEIEIVTACVVPNTITLYGDRRNPRWISMHGSYEIKTKKSETKYDLKYMIPLNDEISKNDYKRDEVFEEVYKAGEKYIEENKLIEAVNSFGKAVELDPNSAKAHFSLGVSYHLMKKDLFAIAEWEATIKLDPKSAPSHFNIGLLLKNREPDTALSKYRDAIDADPNFMPAYIQWGLDLLHSNNVEGAIEKFKEVTKIAPQTDPFHLKALGMWGAALEKTNRIDAAKEKYSKIIALSPYSEEAESARKSISMLKNR